MEPAGQPVYLPYTIRKGEVNCFLLFDKIYLLQVGPTKVPLSADCFSRLNHHSPLGRPYCSFLGITCLCWHLCHPRAALPSSSSASESHESELPKALHVAYLWNQQHPCSLKGLHAADHHFDLLILLSPQGLHLTPYHLVQMVHRYHLPDAVCLQQVHPDPSHSAQLQTPRPMLPPDLRSHLRDPPPASVS